MSGDHVTLRIPKKALFTAAALLIPIAFIGGIAVGGQGSSTAPETIPSSTVVETTSTTTSTVPVSAAAKSVTTTTIAKKKKKSAPATTTTTLPPKLGITASYEDNCPAPNAANPAAAQLPGTITVKWQSTAATRVTLKISHGADKLFDGQVNDLSGQMSFPNRTCNNVYKFVNGQKVYTGQPLTVTYQLAAYDTAGTLSSTNGEGQF